MNDRVIKLLRVLVFFLILLPLLASAGSSGAQAGDPYALLDAVNQLRAANGRPPYQMNSALMISAQNHSNYQASLGTWTHEGPGGTNETQRAVAAGYGAGANVMCDENVAYGLNLSAQGCVDMWKGDAPHLNNMLSARYVEAGAGATTDANGRVFYTLDVCYIVGSSNPNPPLPPGTTATPLPTLEPFFRVQTVTPASDGAVVHVVKPGQSLYAIAEAYAITLDELLKLNSLTKDSVIQPGDELIIRTVSPATPTLEASSTPTRPPATPTRRPTRTPTTRPPASPTPEKSPLLQATATQVPAATGDVFGNVLLIAVLLLVVAGVGMVVLGGVMKRSA